MPASTPSPIRRIPIVVANAALRPFASIWRASAPLIAESGVGAAFIAGLTATSLGRLAPWAVLLAVLAGMLLRRAELESWALFIPGGLIGRVYTAFGRRPAIAAGAAAFIERILFVGLVASVAGHDVVFVLVTWIRRTPAAHFTPEDLVTLAAVVVVGATWIRTRLGRSGDNVAQARWRWLAIAVVIAVVVGVGATAWGAVDLRPHFAGLEAWSARFWTLGWMAAWPVPARLFIAGLVALGLALPALGTADEIGVVAAALPQPRVLGVRRLLALAAVFAVVATAGSTFLFVAVLPESTWPAWSSLPLIGLAQQLSPVWLRTIVTLAAASGVVVMLASVVAGGLSRAESLLHALVERGVLSDAIAARHPRLGTFWRLSNTAVIAVVTGIVVSGARVEWLAGAYALALACTQLVKVASLARLRKARPSSAGRMRALPVFAGFVLLGGLGLLASGNPGVWVGVAAVSGLATVFVLVDRGAVQAASDETPETFQLLPSTDLALDHVAARPGGILVAVRHPHLLEHLVPAFRHAADRDVVVMTARLVGPEADGDAASEVQPTAAERELFSHVMAIAEQHEQPVRLLVMPAHNVFDAVVSSVIRLESSEVFVGESATLPAAAQARLLGDAWERADTPESLKVRLVIHHSSGRNDTFFLGAHAPSLTPQDVDLIHHLWLDATKSIGPHVHHHDVVRAALLQMSEQLTGTQREEALDAIRRVARQADELAAVVRARDYSHLRDMVRNLPPDDLAHLLTDLGTEEQVVVFRILPRKDAAAAFEYLEQEAQEALLKAMAQEDVASILNEMAPDDRTTFLEELPATATRQLLTLLTPEERAIASKLLGYPEDSIGRLMTPDYIAVREDWTIQQVLDYVRQHGQDSETLNVIYVVDDEGLLVDDIRIREILLTPPDKHVSSIMDRRFVALKATDREEEAVAMFKEHDRTALPVTDTAGMLIGIVTVDDVLDVAEAKATKEIQRIGGSEALDEPYNTISFWRMVKKRAGWLTALFLGEMLTATAMQAYGDEVAKAVVLAFFIPLTISSGGNSGSQASTLIIRAMALGEVKLTDWFWIMRRELRSGFTLGVILGAIGFLRITIWSQFSDMYGPHWLLVATTVGVALVGIVTWGTLVGSLLPLILRRLGFDPATSSAPFVATLVDVTGLIIYFSVAMVILKGTLL